MASNPRKKKKVCYGVMCYVNVMFFLKFPNILFALQSVSFPPDIMNIDEYSQNIC